MSKHTKKQRRKKLLHKKKLKKAKWEEKCIDKLIKGAIEIIENDIKEKEDESTK